MSSITSQQRLKVIYGAANWGFPLNASSPGSIAVSNKSEAQTYLSILQNHSVAGIDTSRAYPHGNSGTSESLLGESMHDPSVASSFTIDTKVASGPGDHLGQNIVASISKSLAALQMRKVHILYLHWPDRTVSLEEPLRGVDEAYRQGLFSQFGISNYSAGEIEEMMEICDREGLVKPTVYQGQYNPLCRRGETQLFPTLRKFGISFYAWGPAAGGAFSKTGKRMGRKDQIGDLMRLWYGDGKTDRAVEAAERFGLTGHEMSLRWTLHHSLLDASKGDAIIIGASKPEQLESSLMSCEQGPLPEELVKLLNEVWAAVEANAPSYSPWVDVDGNPFAIEYGNNTK